MPKLTLPSIHLNGSSAASLKEQYKTAALAVETAIKAVQSHPPHGRDYYPQGDDAWPKAMEQHKARLTKLTEVYAELEELWHHAHEHTRK